MLHKTISCLNGKLLPLLNASKIRCNYFIIGSRIGSKSFSSSQKDTKHDGTILKCHPTSNVTSRGVQTGTNEAQNKPVLILSNLYSFKFVYALIRDSGVKYHVGRSFLDGVGAAFFFVSDCLNNKNYDGLDEVVTPELLKKIKDQDILSKKADSSVLRAKHVSWFTLANMNWSIDEQTKIKTLEVLVRFAFFDKYVPRPKSLGEWWKAMQTGKVEGSALNFAHFKFYRTYGEEMKDSPWIIKDLLYFKSEERFLVSSR